MENKIEKNDYTFIRTECKATGENGCKVVGICNPLDPECRLFVDVDKLEINKETEEKPKEDKEQ